MATAASPFPYLWCPLLTHYRADGSLDVARMQAHLQNIRPSIRGYLVPGSTGDAWLMSDDEAREVLAFLLDHTGDDALVSVGALKTTTEDTLRFIMETENFLQNRSGGYPASVAGYTVCPPVGADKSQNEIEEALGRILLLGHPTTLYQLPQITQNSISPEVVARLAARFPNLTLFKDSSGTDTVALACQRGEIDPGRVFLVRGAEGDFGKWLKGNGGPYNGYLLSTANCFAPQLAAIVEAATTGTAQDPGVALLAGNVSGCVADAFAAVVGISAPGNAFTHANKAMDHFMAYGPEAPLDADMLPLLHGGVRLPESVMFPVREALLRWNCMPQVGYLETSHETGSQ